MAPMTSSKGLIELNSSFIISALSIAFNPTFWNIIARQEYHNKLVSKMFGGPRKGCYALALTIFSLGIFRDWLYERALKDQPTYALLDSWEIKLLALGMAAFGATMVYTSMWKLGVTGTYLGDYFGIFLPGRVTSFPFNINANPMYNGSVLIFIATALWKASPAGLLLSLEVFIGYRIACRFEEPFTDMIFSNRNSRDVEQYSITNGTWPKELGPATGDKWLRDRVVKTE